MIEVVKPEDILSQKHPMPEYKEIGYHIIFNINIDGSFIQTAMMLANGHETEYVPKWDTYS